MREFRQNSLTGQWVIIASERDKRPGARPATGSQSAPSPPDGNCPFCPGREGRTPPEVYAVRDDYATADRQGWKVRVIPNKYPALTIDAEGAPSPESMVKKGAGETNESQGGAIQREAGRSLCAAVPGVGMHEVVIESPAHDRGFSAHEAAQAELIVQTLRHRHRMIMQARDVKLVCIFKNHGPRSGSTIRHPHFQIIAPAVVPPLSRTMVERQAAHADKTGSPLFETLLEEELSAGRRVVTVNDKYVTLTPWASQMPYEMWIVPREQAASFGDLPDAHTALFTATVQDALQRMQRQLDDPDYNLVIHSAPKGRQAAEHHRWFVQIVPRLITAAGFEHATGMYINPTPPEQAAAALREKAESRNVESRNASD